MTDTGYVVGFVVRIVVTLVLLGAAAAAVRYGWTYPERRRQRRAMTQRQNPPRT